MPSRYVFPVNRLTFNYVTSGRSKEELTKLLEREDYQCKKWMRKLPDTLVLEESWANERFERPKTCKWDIEGLYVCNVMTAVPRFGLRSVRRNCL